MVLRSTPPALSRSQTASSRAWLARQSRDPYVRQRLSDPAGYRSRSAFKLLELDKKWGGFLTRNNVRAVVDLGAAPGGWSQVVAGKMGWIRDRELLRRPDVSKPRSLDAEHPVKLITESSWHERPQSNEIDIEDPCIIGRGTIIAVDRLPIAPINGVHALQIDFLSSQAESLIKSLLSSDTNPHGEADIILSDMAPNISGNRIHDIESSLELSRAVFSFARRNLSSAESVGRPRGGLLLLKHFTHPLLQQFRVEHLDPSFHDVKVIKPDASRAASSEAYWLCQGWNGAALELEPSST